MDELALSIAALECGHRELLGADANAVGARATESGRHLLTTSSDTFLLADTADAVAGADVIAGPVELSDHPLCVVGILLRFVVAAGVGPPAPGAGPVTSEVLRTELERRGRDGGASLVGSLRLLRRMRLVEWKQATGEVRVGVALACQPASFFETLASVETTG